MCKCSTGEIIFFLSNIGSQWASQLLTSPKLTTTFQFHKSHKLSSIPNRVLQLTRQKHILSLPAAYSELVAFSMMLVGTGFTPLIKMCPATLIMNVPLLFRMFLLQAPSPPTFKATLARVLLGLRCAERGVPGRLRACRPGSQWPQDWACQDFGRS